MRVDATTHAKRMGSRELANGNINNFDVALQKTAAWIRRPKPG
jgi:hypothetical protein